MPTTDTFMDFEQDAVCPTSVDTLEKWNGKSSSVKFAFNQDVRASPPLDNGHFFWVIGEFSLSEVVVYVGHPTIAVPDGEYF